MKQKQKHPYPEQFTSDCPTISEDCSFKVNTVQYESFNNTKELNHCNISICLPDFPPHLPH